MKRRSRTAARKAARMQRFLRPGALARLRDSKISSRSPRSALKALQLSAFGFSPPGSPVAGAVVAPPDGLEGERICFFSSRQCTPRLLQRKKLAAAKYVFFAPPSPDPSDPVPNFLWADPIFAH